MKTLDEEIKEFAAAEAYTEATEILSDLNKILFNKDLQYAVDSNNESVVFLLKRIHEALVLSLTKRKSRELRKRIIATAAET